MLKKLAPAALLVLTACASQPNEPAIKPVVTGPQAAAKASRFDVVTIRTFQQQGFRRTELLGLNCTITGTGYRAIFQSPNRIALPVYRGRTDDAQLSCTRPAAKGGVQTATTVIEATNITAEAAEEGLSISTGTGGTSVRLGVSLRDRSRDRFDYPDSVRLDLR